MTLGAVLQALIPWYGAGARFRFYLRLREFYRKHHMYFLGQCLKSHLQYKYGCEIAVNATISPAASFMHTVGVVIGEGVIIDQNVTIYSGVCLGRKDIQKDDDYPIIQEGSILCTDCSVLGKIVVARHTTVGAKSLVITDTHPGGTYVGIPAKLIK